MIAGKKGSGYTVKRNINVKRKDTLEVEFYYRKDGLLVDLDSNTYAQLQIRNKKDIKGKLVKQVFTTIDTENDKIIAFLPAELNDIDAGIYYYDLEILKDGKHITIYEGIFTVYPEITDWKKLYHLEEEIELSTRIYSTLSTLLSLKNTLSSRVNYSFNPTLRFETTFSTNISFEIVLYIVSIIPSTLLTNISYQLVPSLLNYDVTLLSTADYSKDIFLEISGSLTTKIKYEII